MPIKKKKQKRIECPECCGSKYIPQYIMNEDGFHNWNGINKKCKTCKGKGYVNATSGL